MKPNIFETTARQIERQPIEQSIYTFKALSGAHYVQVFENGKLLASWSAYTEQGKKQRIGIATELYPNAILKTQKP
jgi:hypothetical protein